MERLLINALRRWKQRETRKPVLLDGARQTGKTYLINELFGPREFRQIVKLDFLVNPMLCSLFQDSIHPDNIISNIEAVLNVEIKPKQDLIFLDEIGECQRALDSLKYFAEIRPDYFVCASGSNLGLVTSFPVGKVEWLELFPCCFEEFVMASGNDRLLDAFRYRGRNVAIHMALWDLLRQYYFVGGMPAAVAAWHKDSSSMHKRMTEVEETQENILQGLSRDFGKYSTKDHASHIDAVFRNVPRQLSQFTDESVKRFRFGNVIEYKRRYRELRSPIDHLERTKLLWKCSVVTTDPVAPLFASTKENLFKLYLFDVGLLGRLLNLSYSDHMLQDLTYKGFFAENFVAAEYRARVGYPMYGWQKNSAEIEFLHRAKSGSICPVEVKSGKRTKAKSLRMYVDRYRPEHAIKLANVTAPSRVKGIATWPLYDVQFLKET